MPCTSRSRCWDYRHSTETLADHLDRLYRAAWALTGSRGDAKDLMQETCARVLAKSRTISSAEDACAAGRSARLVAAVDAGLSYAEATEALGVPS